MSLSIYGLGSAARHLPHRQRPGELCDHGTVRTEESTRLRTLFQTGLAISSELSLDGVLQRIVEAAALVTGARYAALGVIDPTGTSLQRFVTHGMDDDTQASIGDLPRGRGILGALMTDDDAAGCTTWPRTRAPSGFRLAIHRSRNFLGNTGRAARRRVRQPVSDGERRRRLRAGRRGARLSPLGPGGRRDRQRTTLRVGDCLVPAARVAAGNQHRAGRGARAPQAAAAGGRTTT